MKTPQPSQVLTPEQARSLGFEVAEDVEKVLIYGGRFNFAPAPADVEEAQRLLLQRRREYGTDRQPKQIGTGLRKIAERFKEEHGEGTVERSSRDSRGSAAVQKRRG